MLRGGLPVHWPSLAHPENHCQRGVRNVNSVAAPNHKKLVSRRVAPLSRLQLRFSLGKKLCVLKAQRKVSWIGPPLSNDGGFWHVLCTTVGQVVKTKKKGGEENEKDDIAVI